MFRADDVFRFEPTRQFQLQSSCLPCLYRADLAPLTCCVSLSFICMTNAPEWIRAIGRAIVMVKTKKFVNDDGSDDLKD